MQNKKGSAWSSLISFFSEHRVLLVSGAQALLWIVLILQLAFVRSLWLLTFLLAPIPSLAYFLSNFLITDLDEKKKALKSYYGSWAVTATAAVNSLLILIVPTFSVLDKTVDLRRIVCIIADILLITSVGYLVRRPLMKVRLQKIMSWNLPQKLGYKGDLANLNEGDIVLCRDKESNQEAVIPRKDRFLHMLVLGPTGSGKTSQIILPMLNQDLQNAGAGITVIEPKGDLAEKAFAMAQYYGREAVYFNPVLKGCPTFNPLYGKEEDVVENIVTTFKMLDPDSAQYFQDMNEQLLRNALKLLKRSKGNDATLIDLSTIVMNPYNEGRNIVTRFAQDKGPNEAINKENQDIASYFLSDYYMAKSKTFENTSGVRSQIAKIVSNKFLRRVLNPKGHSDINFDQHLENGTVLCISTAQGKLRELGKYLGYFIILNFQSSTFKRPGNENTRRDHFLYIDEFQSYANPGFADMLTQGRSYRVASHLATQNRALIGMGSGKDGEDFIELVSTNARNIVLFPGGNFMDAKYYSDQFGEVEKITIGESTAVSAGSPIMTQGRQPTKDTFQIKEDMEARMSPTDIILREFGEITFSIVKNNTLQPARIGRISYIDKDLNQTLDQMIDENNKMMLVGLDPNEYRDFNNHGALKKELLNWDLLLRDCDSIAEEERQDSLRVAREKNVRLNRYDVGGDPNVLPGEDLDEEKEKKKENAEQNSLASRGSDDGESSERGSPIFAEEVKRSTGRKEGGSGDPSQIVTKQDLEDTCLS